MMKEKTISGMLNQSENARCARFVEEFFCSFTTKRATDIVLYCDPALVVAEMRKQLKKISVAKRCSLWKFAEYGRHEHYMQELMMLLFCATNDSETREVIANWFRDFLLPEVLQAEVQDQIFEGDNLRYIIENFLALSFLDLALLDLAKEFLLKLQQEYPVVLAEMMFDWNVLVAACQKDLSKFEALTAFSVWLIDNQIGDPNAVHGAGAKVYHLGIKMPA